MRGTAWSDSDHKALVEMAGQGVKVSVIADRVGRSIYAVHARARSFNIDLKGSTKKPHWTDAEIDSLKRYFATGSREDLEKLFPGRDWQAIDHRGRRTHRIRASIMHRLRPAKLGVIGSHKAAYLAGLVDGEGTISVGFLKSAAKVGHGGSVLSPFVMVVNTNYGLVEWLKETLGDAVSIGRSHQRPEHNKACYQVRVNGLLDIQAVLRQILPYLVIKRRQAELMLEYCEIRLQGTWMNYDPRLFDLAKEMRRLNERGPPKTGPPSEPPGAPTLLAQNAPSPA